MKQFTLKSLLLVLTILMGGVNAWGEEVTFGSDWNTVFGTEYSGTFPTTQNALTLNGSVQNVNIQVNNGTSTNGYVKTGDFRVYKGYTIVFTAPDGFNIAEMSSVKGGKTFSSGVAADSGELSISNSSIKWNGLANSVKLTISGTVSFSTITLSIISDSALPLPAFSIEDGKYWKEQTLELTTTVKDGTIYYTIDGNDPTETSRVYSSPIQIKETTTVKACVKDANGKSSDVAEHTYTFVPSIANNPETAYTTAKAIELIDKASIDETFAEQLADEKVYVKGIVNEIVTEFSSKYGNITFNIISTDRKDTRVFQFFRNQKSEDETYGEDPNIMIGASVVGCGNLSKHGETYEFSAKNYLVSYTAPKSASLLATDGTANYATFSSDRDVEFVDATVYAVNVVNGVLQLNEVTSKQVPAGTGVLLKSENETAPYFYIDEADAIENNLLKPASEEMSGSYTFYKFAYDDYDAKTGLGFYWGEDNGGVFNVKAGTAYLAVPVSNTASVKGFLLDGTPTAIEGVEAENNTDVIYNLSGQRVQKAQRGLYIVNGKKFMVK